MTYYLEMLGDERFQQLCQTLVAAVHPAFQCLPVGQPDGGRDGFIRQSESDSATTSIVYQVKFVKNPASREARDEIMQVIATEKKKIEKLISKGASEYILMTNVSGTSHLDNGSIDQLNVLLTERLGLKAMCWWRDDIERRIDTLPEVKWSYPEILRAQDLLKHLISSSDNEVVLRRENTIRRFIAYQAKYDAELKFRQVELQRSLVDLFVDVPARISVAGEKEDSESSFLADCFGIDVAEEFELLDEEGNPAEETSDSSLKAFEILTNEAFARRFSNILIEGGPGQGKSTVTQFLCQVHRLRLLGRSDELTGQSDKHLPRDVRIPIRIDLRDYAMWLAGTKLVLGASSSSGTQENSPLLESFLAAQITRNTGSPFSVDDLTAVARLSRLLIVLDGFDEVADISVRAQIVTETTDAATRIKEVALSAQILVTSRPTAFANSPGFPRESWPQLQLLSLSRSAINEYAKKWLSVRTSDEREQQEVLAVLQDNLHHSHIRDLARNPMQLAILMALIMVQGASLPDKRTALYDKYIDIFLNRESEKSLVVREHRELLLQIHRFLAWTLQAEAETNSSAGNITESQLREVLRLYLDQNGHKTDLVDRLFTGMVERVVALVSRIQGTYEFEVQPLREYFAARHLYDTAPYAPAGRPCTGTRPDRFDAIARNYYWLNVARFYAGCYSTGELASLIDGIEALGESGPHRLTSHPSHLGITFLRDYVFSQNPRAATRVSAIVFRNPRFLVFMATWVADGNQEGLWLPPGPSRETLVNLCREIVRSSTHTDLIFVAGKCLQLNCTTSHTIELWNEINQKDSRHGLKVSVALYLGVLEKLDYEQLMALARTHPESVGSQILRRGDRRELLVKYPELTGILEKPILDQATSPSTIGRKFDELPISTGLLTVVGTILRTYRSVDFKTARPQKAVRQLGGMLALNRIVTNLGESADPKNGVLSELAAKLLVLLNCKLDRFATDLKPWSEPIEFARSYWGDHWLFYELAVSVVDSLPENAPSLAIDPTDQNETLLRLAKVARAKRNDEEWWSRELDLVGDVQNSLVPVFLIRSFFLWAPIPIILGMGARLSSLIERLSNKQWWQLMAPISGRRTGSPRAMRNGQAVARNDLPKELSAKFACLLMERTDQKSTQMVADIYLMKYTGTDYHVLLQMIISAGKNVLRDPEAWEQALKCISYAYSNGQQRNILGQFVERNTPQLPQEIAERVCSEPEKYPLYLVGVAEQRLAERAGAASVPVGAVAARDHWFADS